MAPLTDISARLAFVWKGITPIQIDFDKIYVYLDTLVTHTMSPLSLIPSTIREILENIKRGMAQHPWLALEMILTYGVIASFSW